MINDFYGYQYSKPITPLLLLKILKTIRRKQIKQLKHITLNGKHFSEKIKKMIELQNATTVIDFLKECNKINNSLYIEFINVLKNTPEDIEFKFDFKNYIPNTFTELFEEINNLLWVTYIYYNNIENNIKHNRKI